MFIELPTRFHHAGNLPLAGQLTEADAANLETPNIRAPTTTVLASVVRPRLELSGPTLLHFPSQFRHTSIL